MSEFSAGPDLYSNPETKKGDDDDDDSPEQRGKRASLFERDKSKDKDKESETKPPKRIEWVHIGKAETADSKDAPETHLSRLEEKQVIQEEAAQSRLILEQQLAEFDPGSPEAQMAEIVAKELKRIEATGVIDPEDIESGVPIEGIEVETDGETELSLDESEGEILLAAPSDTEPQEPEDVTAGSAATTPPPPAPSTGGGRAGGNSGNQPPPPPGLPGPIPGPIPGPQPNRNVWPLTPQHSPNTTPPPGTTRNALLNPNVYTPADLAYYEQRAATRGLLVGGILGYLIGRRRGRIRTEKRLLPIQNRLEKQVKEIQEKLDARELKVRTLAYERLPQVRKTERIAPLPRRVIEAAPEGPVSRLELEKPARIERLGKTVVNAEAPREVKPELRSITPENVKSMNTNELLLLSEKVVVEGASLRQIYEQHLIGERGLRHLLSEYLQGKDIRRELHNEMVEREIDFERDPMLRDTAQHSVAAGGSASSLQQLLEKAGATATPDESLLPIARLKAAAQAEAHEREHRRRSFMDAAMVTLIVVLAVAITILLLKR